MLRELLGQFRVVKGPMVLGIALLLLLSTADDLPGQTVQSTDAQPTTAAVSETESSAPLPCPHRRSI